MEKTASEVLVDQLAKAGVKYNFWNSGSQHPRGC